MCEYKFKFPLLNGGRSSGLNNAGIETFKSNPVGALARECAQNSLDAKSSETLPAKLAFKFHRIRPQDVPGFLDLKTAFEQCEQFWPNNSPESKFSHKALALFSNRDISVLEIADYDTTGLRGEDKEIGSPWYALVMAAGVCNKSAESAGGFGIGKYASFVLSTWRTVFYSSLTMDGNFAFRGVCDNMTHRDSEGRETQGIGYYGRVNENGSIESLRDPKEIPDFFRREKPGTSIFVLAFQKEEADSKEQLKKAVLENFWPAIYFQKIHFDIDGEVINKDNLAEQMVKYDDLKLFIQCLTSPSKIYAKEDVGLLKGCELYFLLTDEKYQELVCTRSSRMKIQSITNHWRLDGVSFVALFSCLSPEGNKILKNMEPPEHSKWEYKRSNDEDDPLSESDRKDIIKSLKEWVRKKINDQVKKNFTDETDMEDVARYFNELSDADGGGDGGEKNHDGFSASVKKIKVSKILTGKVTHRVEIPVAASAEQGEGGVVAPDPSGGQGGGGRGAVRGGEEGGLPGDKQAGNAKKIKFFARSFIANDEYVVIVKPQKDFNGTLQLLASGEEENETLEIIEARTDARDFAILDGKISAVSMISGETYKLYVQTREREHFSVEVIGYESH